MENKFREEFNIFATAVARTIYDHMQENPECEFEDILKLFNVNSKQKKTKRWLNSKEYT